MHSTLQKKDLPYQKHESQHAKAEKLIAKALVCLEKRLRNYNDNFNNPQDVCAYSRLQLAREKEEVFAAFFLNNNFQLLAFDKLFYGTINKVPVYPRKVVQKALGYNAAKIIIAHNHPSGNCKPSNADREITKHLKKILITVDVELIDHIIVSHQEVYSLAAHQLL